ncbi:L-serine ammonia-lyase, iron-sulfur-dependent, subunit alpha [Terasakiella sp. A23]|uniref:L-serine ammonia-lyase, iron-sulfur-dependent, subunit alpha n=1 Tax=Terasakiella sp. FCG-A23 TaxID=3080561 RepID=UPI002952ECAF|nr:L-serine ammonia-lyase, iron-sulfur-dependent, subunit alpha [Terasakiella sp. A23]MDV7341245.1 L-serine ammonia-lyase, iron-sulfur-dependent, subunit alpha [Terasakiella sp. A23]
MTHFPSIFNDAIGPVMRGASSSHVAAAHRIGLLARDYMDGDFSSVLVEYDPNTSLEPTHDSQGSDMGLFCGLMGWEVTDERMVDARKYLEGMGVETEIRITDYGATHENTYKLTLRNEDHSLCLYAISIGGGMVEIIEINGTKVSVFGDYHETFVEGDVGEVKADYILERDGFTQIKSQHPLNIPNSRSMAPVLPVGARKDLHVPFSNADELQKYNKDKGLSFWELALEYESQRGNLSTEAVYEKMRAIVRILDNSIDQGLAGTEYEDRIYPAQAPLYKEKGNNSLNLGLYDDVIAAVTALMDVKSSMGVIVAAPTAGSCGTLPGTVLGVANALGMSEDQKTRAMLSAGLIGVFIAHMATFSAEIGGCQAETGSGSGMAAAGLVTLFDGSVDQCLAAASMALQNTFGLVCDPVANRVEAPCLGKNVLMAGNALSASNMVLAGFDALIPLDEVIVAMHQVGQSIPCELRCTGKGGLATTPTGQKLFKQMNCGS